MGLLQNGRDTLVIGDAEKAELLNAAFALGQDQPAGISDLGDQGRGLLEGRLSLHQEDWVGEHPGKLDILKSMDPARIYPQVLRELMDTISRLLTITFENWWHSVEVPED